MKYASKQELIEGRAEAWMNTMMSFRKASGVDVQSSTYKIKESRKPGEYLITIYYDIKLPNKIKKVRMLLEFNPLEDSIRPIWDTEPTGLIGKL